MLKFEKLINRCLAICLIFYCVILSIYIWQIPETPIPNELTVFLIIISILLISIKVICLLSPQRTQGFVGVEVIVFLMLYALNVLIFSSFYYNSYRSSPEKAFKINMGMDIIDIDQEIIILSSNIGDKGYTKEEFEKYQKAERDAENNATNCIEIPDFMPNPNQLEPFYIPKYSCNTNEKLRIKLLQTYINDRKIDIKKVNEFKEFQKIQEQLDRKRDQLARLTYFDFLYFSSVTSATVGYGDITPNILETKLAVIAQIAINLFLTLVLVNLFNKK